MIINREIENTVRNLSTQFPVITITGPRQSGKTTLSKKVFPHYEYRTLEDPDIREFALSDPRGFLGKSRKGMILDEIQKAPQLLSYIQGMVDANRTPGEFILTGSQQFDLMGSISQSLAGRTAILKLLPFSMLEAKRIREDSTLDETIFQGFYPAVHEQNLNPTIAYRNYFETYIQRDLRQLINVKDIRLFQKFVRLCAGRIGQVLSANSLANDVGVSVPTINSWLSILECSYIVFFLEPYYGNIGKRLIKSPKLYFHDVGLASYLLGIESTNQLERDPLRGFLFENLVLMELVKKRYNQGLDHNLFFYRDNNRNEVDIVCKTGNRLIPVEVKSASTFTTGFLKGLAYLRKIMPEAVTGGYLVYSGEMSEKISGFTLMNYKDSETIVE